MSIVKIQSVNRLKQTFDYIMQGSKTKDDFITTYDCDQDFILEDFNSLYDRRKQILRKETKNKAKMIIQSFDFRDNVSPEQAHEIGVKLANQYLKGNHQYIVTTHIDTDYLHNHIVFNEVRSDNFLMYDSSRKNSLDNLRIENDKLSREYNLQIPPEKSHKKNVHYINQREIKARQKGVSFKENLENTVDQVIEHSNSYGEFINQMETLGFKSKEGRHLAFLNNKNNKFMRTKTLGMNYTENSIKYRIENKDFEINKFKYTVQTQAIDKSQDKFRNNYGLRKWATKKNIAHLQEISHLVFNENKTLEEIGNIQKSEAEFTRDITNKLESKDSVLYELTKKSHAFQDYQDSGNLIANYKKATNKKEFKTNHYHDFKKFDTAKKNMYLLKKNYDIHNLNDLVSYKHKIEEERKELYSYYTKLQKENSNIMKGKTR